MARAATKTPAPCLAVLGTGSDVGKSIVVTALCRWLTNRGFRVAPYKAQNMSNNSGVTPEGLEMGRAQIVQAEACRIAPHVDMNPILLKPTSDVEAQVVLLGEVWQDTAAGRYHHEKEKLFSAACRALDRLRNRHDVVVIEGAGSCAEVNLLDHDLVNFRTAEYADAPVLLVGDIHRGGIFAQLVGTLACLPDDKKRRIAAFIVNRFRGDIELFEAGVHWIREKTGRRVLGVLPWYDHIRIEAEDSVVIENLNRVVPDESGDPAVAVIRIPHISNFTDFDSLDSVVGLQVVFLEKAQDLSGFRAVILPGSKNTRHDLDWIKISGWEKQISAYARARGHILGICGGYQMMGRFVHDPHGIEGRPGSSAGLALLPVETVLQTPKTTTLTHFRWNGAKGQGYEIHMGQTRRLGGDALQEVCRRNAVDCREQEGCLSFEVNAMGTYIHGWFDSPEVLRNWLAHIGLGHLDVSAEMGLTGRQHHYDLLAEHFASYVDTDALIGLIPWKEKT